MVQKRNFYEWSSRVPFIIRFPDGQHAGTKISQPASLLDLVPTFLDMAGVEDRLALDGNSVMSLLDGTDTEEREVISEMHSEGVYAPCFMLRRGQYKYIYIHGHDAQLFDVDNDAGEWHNLAGQPEYRDLESELRARILSQFDPNQIAADVADSAARRLLIGKTMRLNDTHWDYQPFVDATQQFVRAAYSREMDDEALDLTDTSGRDWDDL
jgi:choline-sulfatase